MPVYVLHFLRFLLGLDPVATEHKAKCVPSKAKPALVTAAKSNTEQMTLIATETCRSVGAGQSGNWSPAVAYPVMVSSSMTIPPGALRKPALAECQTVRVRLERRTA